LKIRPQILGLKSLNRCPSKWDSLLEILDRSLVEIRKSQQPTGGPLPNAAEVVGFSVASGLEVARILGLDT
jgi:hypothetical protein